MTVQHSHFAALVPHEKQPTCLTKESKGHCSIQNPKNKQPNLFIYFWRLIAPPTAQGHLRALHFIKSYTSWIQYKTCTFYKRKTHKHNLKVSPFGIALVIQTTQRKQKTHKVSSLNRATPCQIKPPASTVAVNCWASCVALICPSTLSSDEPMDWLICVTANSGVMTAWRCLHDACTE